MINRYVLGAALVATLAYGCSPNEPPETAPVVYLTPFAGTEDELRSRIAPGVFERYEKNPEGYRNTIAKFRSRLDDVQWGREMAAKRVILPGNCERVEMSELSDKSTLEQLHFFVICEGDEYVYRYTEEALKNWSKARSKPVS